MEMIDPFYWGQPKDLRQKEKVRWALDGDKNSNVFHVMINNWVNKSRIHGLSIQGCWTKDSDTIKITIFISLNQNSKK